MQVEDKVKKEIQGLSYKLQVTLSQVGSGLKLFGDLNKCKFTQYTRAYLHYLFYSMFVSVGQGNYILARL